MLQSLDIGREVVGFRQMTGLSSAQGVPMSGTAVMLQAVGANVVIRLDGTDPSGATDGHVLANGDSIKFTFPNNRSLDFIRVLEVAASATVNVHAFK